MLASKSVSNHLVRGVIGGAALMATYYLYPMWGAPALLFLPLSLYALRGCPTCWTVGLIQTIFRQDKKYVCMNGSCGLPKK